MNGEPRLSYFDAVTFLSLVNKLVETALLIVFYDCGLGSYYPLWLHSEEASFVVVVVVVIVAGVGFDPLTEHDFSALEPATERSRATRLGVR